MVAFSAYAAAEELHGVVYLLEGGAPCFAVLAINGLDTPAGCVEAARWRIVLVKNGERMVSLAFTHPHNLKRHHDTRGRTAGDVKVMPKSKSNLARAGSLTTTFSSRCCSGSRTWTRSRVSGGPCTTSLFI